MSKAKHTPGPWECGRIHHLEVFGDDGIIVADCGRSCTKGEDEMEANADLIAAAPDLLAENQANLTWVQNLLCDIKSGRPLNSHRIAEGLEMRAEKTRAAIAKAEGRAE